MIRVVAWLKAQARSLARWRAQRAALTEVAQACGEPTRRDDSMRLLVAGATLVLAAVAYLYGLDRAFIPSIGDEPFYLQIARRTAESGRLLPLLSDSGITNTKPPLLFWLGAAVTRLGGDLGALRLPIVLLTFATAAAVGDLARRISGRVVIGLLSAALFLAYRSTIQHGRPFLTNAGETLFLFLPLLWVHRRDRIGPGRMIACGLSLGAAALCKSFALIVPGVAALGLVLLQRGGYDLRAALRRHGPVLVGMAAIALLAFIGWIVLDPRPDLIVSQFIVGENAGKLRLQDFANGLFSGPYPIWRIWLAPVLNAGLLAPLVVGLLVDLWRRRRALPTEEAELWTYVLAFLVVYSVPTHRQENYLLPAGAALAVLLGLRWDALAAGWFRTALVPLAVAAAALPVLQRQVERSLSESLWSPWALALPALIAAAALTGAVRERLGRLLLPALTFGALLATTNFLAPFSRPFPPAALAEVRGRVVLYPERFQREYELGRTLVPGADVRGYPCPPGPEPCPAPWTSTAYVAWLAASGEAPPPGYRVVAETPHLRTRHSAAEIERIAAGDLGLLIERLVLVRPERLAASSAR